MELNKKHCIPCEGGTKPFTGIQEDEYLKYVPSWSIDREGIHKIRKKLLFKNFKETMNFVNKIADLAEEEGHHPNFCVSYNKLDFSLSTHAIGGLSENDFIMAVKIDDLMKEADKYQQKIIT